MSDTRDPRRGGCASARVSTVAAYPEKRYEVQCPSCYARIPTEDIEHAGEIAKRHRAGIAMGAERHGGNGAERTERVAIR